MMMMMIIIIIFTEWAYYNGNQIKEDKRWTEYSRYKVMKTHTVP